MDQECQHQQKLEHQMLQRQQLDDQQQLPQQHHQQLQRYQPSQQHHQPPLQNMQQFEHMQHLRYKHFKQMQDKQNKQWQQMLHLEAMQHRLYDQQMLLPLYFTLGSIISRQHHQPLQQHHQPPQQHHQPPLQNMQEFEHMQHLRYKHFKQMQDKQNKQWQQMLHLEAMQHRLYDQQMLLPLYFTLGSILSHGPGRVHGNTIPVVAQSPSTSSANEESCTSQEGNRPTSDDQKDVRYEWRYNNEAVIKRRDARKSLLADLEACTSFLKQVQANLISGTPFQREEKAELDNLFLQFQEYDLKFSIQVILQLRQKKMQNTAPDSSQDHIQNSIGQEGVASPVMANANTSNTSLEENSPIPDNQKDEAVDKSIDVRMSQNILKIRDTLLKVKSMVKDLREENTSQEEDMESYLQEIQQQVQNNLQNLALDSSEDSIPNSVGRQG